LSQSFDKDKYEIILVDDGSSDNSLQIIRDFEEKESNIKVYTQPNQKQGAARNRGLRNAKGKYIWFVDSDDWIEAESIVRLYNFLINKEIEVVRIDSKNYINGNYVDRKCSHIPNLQYSGRQILIENSFSVSFPSHIFLKDFLIANSLFFKEHIYFEDNELMVRILIKCNYFIYLNNYLYSVWIREESTTRTENYSRYLDLIKVIEFQKEYMENSSFDNLDVLLKKAICIQIARNMNHCLVEVLYSNGNEFDVAIERLRSVKNLSNIIIKSGSTFHIFQYFLLSFPISLKRLMKIYY
jgi:glycosyltransferase involved in cell wall biosynthesis